MCTYSLLYSSFSSPLATFRDGNRKLEEAARSEGSSLGGIEQRVIDSVCALSRVISFRWLFLGGHLPFLVQFVSCRIFLIMPIHNSQLRSEVIALYKQVCISNKKNWHFSFYWSTKQELNSLFYIKAGIFGTGISCGIHQLLSPKAESCLHEEKGSGQWRRNTEIGGIWKLYCKRWESSQGSFFWLGIIVLMAVSHPWIELETMYYLKKYRALRARYTVPEQEAYMAIQKKLEAERI